MGPGYAAWVPLLVGALLALGQSTTTSTSASFLHEQPKPFSNRNRILTVVLSHNLNHFESLSVILREYASICEAGWLPKVALFTQGNYTAKLRKMVEYKTQCSRLQKGFEVSFENRNVSSTRAYFAEHLDEAEIFVYQEDDMIFRVSHLHEWIFQMWRLNALYRAEEMRDRVVGFLRFRRDNVLHPPVHSAKDSKTQNAEEADLERLDFIEEEPSVAYLCVNETEPFIQFGGNCHQAIWIFVREQVDYMQEKCGFLNQTKSLEVGGAIEYTSDMSIWDKSPNKHNPMGGCDMKKMAPHNVERFLIHHYYPGSRRTWHHKTIYSEVRRVYVGNRAFKGIIPKCWKGLVDEALKEQAQGV